MPQDLLLFISGVGIIQAALLAALIYFYPKSDRSVNIFLALYMICFCIPMSIPIIQHYFTWQILILIDPIPLLSGPFLYFYIRSFKENITWKKMWPHLVMFGAYVVLDISLFIDFINQFQFSSVVPEEVVHHPSSIVRVSFRLIQMIAYFFLANHQLRLYKRSIIQLFSETSKINLDWAKGLLNGYLFLVLFMLLIWVLIQTRPEHFALLVMINTAAVTPYLYLITFKGTRQPTLWQIEQTNKEHVEEEFKIAERVDHAASETKRATMSQERSDEIVKKVLETMAGEKLYLQSELALQELADKLQVHAYLVSQAINEGLGKNFYDLVNGYRVEEASRLLSADNDRAAKIIAVAFDSGFNSKTTFNTVFKKFTGLTPSQFRDKRSTEASLQS